MKALGLRWQGMVAVPPYRLISVWVALALLGHAGPAVGAPKRPLFTPIFVNADVVVTVGAPSTVNVGSDLTYELTVTNGGPGDVIDVVLIDTLPGTVIRNSVTPSLGSCSGTSTITCTFGSLAPGSSATVAIVVTPTVVGTITNTATMTTATIDFNTGNNSVAVVTTVKEPAADLSVTKTAASQPDGRLLYTITVHNQGPSTATGVSVTDNLPGNIIGLGSTPSQGTCTPMGGSVECSLGTLANGATATITILIQPLVSSLTNIVTVTANESDPNLANNTFRLDATVPVAPVASSQSVATREDTAVTIALKGSDVDSASLSFHISIPSGLSHGSLGPVSTASCAVTGAGFICTATVLYTPAANYNGPDSFTFVASDGQLTSAPATVAITVTPVNDPPVFDRILDQFVDGDAGSQVVSITGVAPGPVTATDEAGQPVALTATSSNPQLIPHPTITGTGSTRSLFHQPAKNVDGAATITVTANDGQAVNNTFSQTFTITVKQVTLPAPTPPAVTSTNRTGSPTSVPDDCTTGGLCRNLNGQVVKITGGPFRVPVTISFSGSGIDVTRHGGGLDDSSTQVSATVNVAVDAGLESRMVNVTNQDGGTGTSVAAIVGIRAPPAAIPEIGLGTPPSQTPSGTPAPPSITGLTPSSGLLGGSVTIAGSNFGGTTAANSVTFAGASATRVVATVNSASGTSLTVTVPAQAVDGAVTVAVNGLLSNADKVFTVTNPRLSAVIPGSAVQGGTSITLDLTGSKFGSGATVAFNPATGITVGSVTFVNATNLRVPVTIASSAPLGLRAVTVTNPAGGTSTLPGAFEVKQPVNAFLQLSVLSGAGDITSTYLPEVDAVSVTLDPTGRCTAKTVTPKAVTLQAQFNTSIGGTAPGSVTFTLTSSAIPGTATNEDCELGAPPTKDFSIGSASVTSQQVTVMVPGNGVYQTTLYSHDWGGTTRIDVSGTMRLADGVTQQTVTGSLTVPMDTDGDTVPDVIEKDVALNANLAGANVLNFLNADLDGNGTRDGDDRFVRDGLSNFEKYRGAYLTGPANGSSGAMTGHTRLGAGKRHLFVRGSGFGNDPAITAGFCGINPSTGAAVADATLSPTNPCPPFEVGGAFAERGIEVHDVTGAFTASTVFPRRSLATPSNATLDMATVVYDGVNCNGGEACDHTAKVGVRQWEFPTLGFSAFGTSTAYSTDSRVFKRAVEAYFRDKPYEHRTNDPARVVVAPDGRPMLAPITLVGDSSSRGADNGIVDSKEATVSNQLAGDAYIAGSFSLHLSAMDATNDGCVELPFVSDPTTISQACDPTAYTANPGPQATKRQVVRSLTTHELAHGVGVSTHTSDSSDVMYQYTINWTRDSHFSQAAADLIQIHNKGLQ